MAARELRACVQRLARAQTLTHCVPLLYLLDAVGQGCSHPALTHAHVLGIGLRVLLARACVCARVRSGGAPSVLLS